MCQTPSSAGTVIFITVYEITVILPSLQMKKLRVRKEKLQRRVTEESHPGCLVPEFELSLTPGEGGGCLSPHPHRRTQAPPISAHPDNVVYTVDI